MFGSERSYSYLAILTFQTTHGEAPATSMIILSFCELQLTAFLRGFWLHEDLWFSQMPSRLHPPSCSLLASHFGGAGARHLSGSQQLLFHLCAARNAGKEPQLGKRSVKGLVGSPKI